MDPGKRILKYILGKRNSSRYSSFIGGPCGTSQEVNILGIWEDNLDERGRDWDMLFLSTFDGVMAIICV